MLPVSFDLFLRRISVLCKVVPLIGWIRLLGRLQLTMNFRCDEVRPIENNRKNSLKTCLSESTERPYVHEE